MLYYKKKDPNSEFTSKLTFSVSEYYDNGKFSCCYEIHS